MRLFRVLSVAATSAAFLICAVPDCTYGQTVSSHWVNAVDGNWLEASKWSTNPNYPNSNLYDVQIGALGTPYTVELHTDTVLHDLSLNSPSGTLKHTGGSLTVQGLFSVNGAEYLSEGGRLLDTTVNITNGQFRSRFNADLTNVTFQNATSATILGTFTVLNGLTLDSSVLRLGPGGGLIFESNSTTTMLAGNGEIYFDGDSGDIAAEGSSSSIVTIGEGIQIRTGLGSGTVGSEQSLVNRGLISVQTANSELTMDGKWSNEGLIDVSAGTLKLAGNFTTAGIGNIARSGGTVAIVGTLDNTNSELLLNSDTGSWRLGNADDDDNWSTAQIIGGTISSADNAQLIVGRGVPTLQDVTLNTDVSIKDVEIENSLKITEGHKLVLGDIANGGMLRIENAASLGGAGEIIFDGSGSNSIFSMSSSNGSQIIVEPELTIRTGTGSGIVGGAAGSRLQSKFINQGTIHAKTPGHSITIDGEWENSGILRVTDGELRLGGKFRTADIGTVEHVGGIVSIVGELNNQNSEIQLNDVTGSWHFTAGTILGGTVTTQDSAELIVRGNPLLDGVTMDTDLTVSSASLRVRNGTTFSNHRLTLAHTTTGGVGEIIVGQSGLGDNIEIVFDGLTDSNRFETGEIDFILNANSVIRTGTGGGRVGEASSAQRNNINYGTISSQTLGRTVEVNKFTNESLFEAKNGGTLRLIDCRNNALVTLDGATLIADDYNTSSWTNAGTITADNSTINFRGNWKNTGTIFAVNSILNLDGNFTRSQLGTVTRTGGETNLLGTLNNSSSTLLLDDLGGSWNLAGGRITGGTIAASGGLTQIVVTSDSTLESLTLAAGLDLRGTSSLMIRNSTLAGGPITAGPTNVIMLENAKINTDLNLDAHLNVEVTQGLSLLQQAKLSLNGSASPLTPLRLRFLGSQFLNGTGEVVFNNSPHSIIDVGGGELKVYSPITIRTGSGGGTICLPGDTLYSDGIISSQTPGQTLTIGASTVSNGFFGRFEAINGATLDLQGTNLLNFSNGILNGGRWSVLGDSTLLFPSGNITRNAAIVDVVGENSRFDALDSIEQNAYYLHFGGGRDFETVGNFSNLGSLWIENESEISVMGDFTQSANGNLTMSLTGTDTGEFAVLDASGTAGLAGRLVIYLSGGFHPNVGDSFPILTFSAWTGQFTTLYGRDIGGGLFFDPVYSPTSLTLVVEQAGQGDSDFDGDVDLNDLSVLAANYGAQSGKLWSQGDYDGDGDVDLNDLSLLAGNYGSGEAQAFADFVAIAAVPESGFATVLLAAGMMLRRRRAA